MDTSSGQSESSKIAINNFLSLMSHEMRTPLNAIVGGVNLFTNECSEQNRDSISFINSGVNDLLKLMDIITEMASLNSDNYEMLHANIDIERLVNRLEIEINNSAKITGKPKLSIQCSISDSYQLMFDAEIIFKILFVLCNNILHTCSNPKIGISFSGEGKKHIIRVNEVNGGIPKERVLEVYNPLSCINSSASKLYGYNNRLMHHVFLNEILKYVSAEIEVNTKQSDGAVFQISIPVA